MMGARAARDVSLWRILWLVMSLFSAFVLSSGCARRVPLPEHLRPESTGELLERMRQARVQLRSYSAELQLNYFGEQGRVRTRATLVAQRPDRLRLDVRGPHGGVLRAVACNGTRIQRLDLSAKRFISGPANAQSLDAILGIAPLGLSPKAWLGLLFGEMPVPADASQNYDAREGRFVLTWSKGGQTWRVWVHPRSARPTRAEVSRGGALRSVRVDARDGRGLPKKLHMAVDDHSEVLVRLRDIRYAPELEADVFQIQPPAGVSRQQIDAPLDAPQP